MMTLASVKHIKKMIAFISREEDKLSRFLNTMTKRVKMKTE